MINLPRALLQELARQPFVRRVGRTLLPQPLRRRSEAYVLQTLAIGPPTPSHFAPFISAAPLPTKCLSGRVVMVCGSLQPGGAERQVANTLLGLSKAPGIETLTLLCESLHPHREQRHDFYLPLVRESRAVVREIRRGRSYQASSLPGEVQAALNQLHPLLAVDVLRLYWEFRTMRPQIVHAWLDWCNVRAGLAAALAGVPRIILSGRNLSPRHFKLNSDSFHPAYTALTAMSERRLVMINNSQAGADDYADWLGLPHERIKVVRNGVQFSESNRPSRHEALSVRAQLKIAPSVPLIGGMFRFEEEKQPAVWLKTARQVATAIPEAQFVVYGQGGMRGEMEKLVRDLDIGSRVHFGGVVSPSIRALAPCDLLLLTSRGEGTPNVLLEAQWLGIPVVTTDAGGAGEAVVDGVTGRVVRSHDEASISAAVIDVLADETYRNRTSTEGPAFVSSAYGMDRMIRETLEVYDVGKSACSEGDPS